MKSIETGVTDPYSGPMTFEIPAGHAPARLTLHFAHLTLPTAVHIALASAANLQLNPDTNALPGGDVLQRLMNGLDGWALALSLVGLVIGAAAWALGSHGQNYQQSFVGRRAVLISGLAALLIGAGPGIVNFFFNTGQGVH
jgi:hypothetical protein